MSWHLRDPVFAGAAAELVARLNGECALAGVVGIQAHMARAIGIDKLAPAALAIEVIPLGRLPVPAAIGAIPVRVIDARGFEASIASCRRSIVVGVATLAVASPEHILGTTLAADDLGPAGRWASFALMRSLEREPIDLEEVRGFLKRTGEPEREELLHELAYLAA